MDVNERLDLSGTPIGSRGTEFPHLVVRKLLAKQNRPVLRPSGYKAQWTETLLFVVYSYALTVLRRSTDPLYEDLSNAFQSAFWYTNLQV